MLDKLTREHTVDADDMRAVLAAGASRQQIEDALAVCFSFNVIGRLADAFGLSSRVPRPSRRAQNTCWRAATAEVVFPFLLAGHSARLSHSNRNPQRGRFSFVGQHLRRFLNEGVFVAIEVLEDGFDAQGRTSGFWLKATPFPFSSS